MLQERVLKFLSKKGLRLNTDLGQHYLVSEHVLDAIMRASAVGEKDTVLEIGPGIGVLTERLLIAAQQVIAVELDGRIIPLLRDFLSEGPAATQLKKLSLIEGNALSLQPPNQAYTVVANIPYHITSPLLRHLFLESSHTPTSLTLMIQKEVAETICDTKSAGLLTILVGLFGTPRMIAHVDPSCFIPAPAVLSAVIHIDCYQTPKASPPVMQRLFSLTKLAFGQKRKMLSNTIGSLPEGKKKMDESGIEPTRRPQSLTIDEWIRLASSFERQ